MDSADAYFLVMFVGLAALMLTLSSVGQAQALEIVLRETLPVPSEYPKLEAIRDLDGDGALDLVLWQWQGMVNPYRYYKVLEREGEGWVERFTYEQSPMRLVLVEDVDGDGRPEILSADYSSVTIHEATADNVYEVRYQSSGFGSFVEKPSAVGDSNGNRKLEFMIPREPTQVSILEGSADNTYTNLGSIGAGGPNCLVGGISDLDGDGHKEIVFSSGGSEWGTYIYEHASNEPLAYERVYEAPSFLAYYGLGDTDGNGRMEIIGTTNTYFDDVRTLENTGDNSYDEVLTVPSTSWSRHGAVDVDGDGRTELLHTLTEARNILVIETRSGSELQEVWNSGSLFQESGEDIYAYHGILAIGDSDNNGYPEFAVLQGDQLHILEVVPEPSSAALLCAAAAGLMAYACRKAKCRPRFFRSRCRCRKRRSEPIVVGR